MSYVQCLKHLDVEYTYIAQNGNYYSTTTMRGLRKFCPSGSNYDNVFSVVGGREDPNTTISAPSSVCRPNAI